MSPPSSRNSFDPQKWVILFFAIVFLASMWPVYPVFSKIHPMLFGIPFSLAYLMILLGLCFGALLGFYVWEKRKGRLD